MATATIRNGIDVGALLATIEAIKARPDLAQFTFRANTRWHDGTHSRAQIGSFLQAGIEDATRQAPFELTELCGYVQATSPVKDILANPVPVVTTLELI